MKIAVIGAGPIGLQAALPGLERGHDVTVFEQSDIGASLIRWGPTRFFSPLGMNVSVRVRTRLDPQTFDETAIITGPEFVDRVMRPISRTAPLIDRIQTGTRVVHIARDRMLRRDRPGHPMRAERAFSLLVEKDGTEAVHTADVIFDCSGSFEPTYVGPGGRAALGDRAHQNRIVHYLGDLHDRLPQLTGRHVMVVGAGHSAATAVVWLDRLAVEHPGTKFTWVVRSLNRRPSLAVASDPLPERKHIVDRANDLAASPPDHLTVMRRTHVLKNRGR